MKYIVIGINDSYSPYFSPDILEEISKGKVFSGGKRHHEIVKALLPKDIEWIDITIPLEEVFYQYNKLDAKGIERIIVFASGDPLFFGFANTIKRKEPNAIIKVYPTFNSLQTLAHRLIMQYHDMRIVSLTGRPWTELDKALIERSPKIGILTDKEHTPAMIAQRMIKFGYTTYQMHIGEHLGNSEMERITSCTIWEASKHAFDNPNCLIIETPKELLTVRQYGIPDQSFELLNGREKMITKMPIRLLTLQALELNRHHVLWDIGFCTGSVSIEARLQFPDVTVVSFEIREEGKKLMYENSRKFGTPGITTLIGDFLTIDISDLPKPDAVFIGGHGGRLKEMMAKVMTVLQPGGCIVMNSVPNKSNSEELFKETIKELRLHMEPVTHITLNDYNPIDILKATNK
ncbi:MAG: precorrin-6y C5,15-methyltransferase (decarboxylating) subunit CbiE [Phocaeicola sp.]|uniref:precorrin-6y C5,15-methyltransferase (decarboxylating) subunit CbiE n=1 Tax=Phocaeicola TaxID=909656 RepID=UPI00234E8F38|nr:precorrin-6y C5,15-methyltransferase (decarboxylating) subunit CbiE [Phocaeicola oris]MCE2615556.1 precorrin-6y C5,15-methyltransferase (decarboxylating) subunit CbiE [Phocaeicola oris]